MNNIYPLVMNETLKIWKKKRFFVILLVLVILIPIFTYAQLKVAQQAAKQYGTKDWKISVQNQIYDMTNRMNSPRVAEEWKKFMMVQVQLLQYYLDNNVDPNSPNAVTFTRGFVQNSVSLFIPLLVMGIASDLVSGERSTGTIKMLLTRPIRRWKILLSKWIALILYVSLIVLATVVLAYLISGIVFGYSGWTMPVFTGFQVMDTEVDLTHVHAVPQWLFILMQSGLAWYVAFVIACLSLMISVLVRSTAASIVIMMASIIAGNLLTSMASSWHSAKYLFSVNLQLPEYLSGQLPPIPGMTLTFSLIVLTVWAIASLVIAFRVFTKQDILN